MNDIPERDLERGIKTVLTYISWKATWKEFLYGVFQEIIIILRNKCKCSLNILNCYKRNTFSWFNPSWLEQFIEIFHVKMVYLILALKIISWTLIPLLKTNEKWRFALFSWTCTGKRKRCLYISVSNLCSNFP